MKEGDRKPGRIYGSCGVMCIFLCFFLCFFSSGKIIYKAMSSAEKLSRNYGNPKVYNNNKENLYNKKL